MKAEKYGYYEFAKPLTIRFAVMVPLYEFDKENSNTVKTQTMAFITDTWINRRGQYEWRTENSKPAYMWETREEAQDFCMGLAWDGATGYVVECLGDKTPTNKW